MHTVLILMGVSGCGKTLIGKKLAKELGCQFIEGDDYHSAENKRKMERGIGLNDMDRQGWLISLRDSLSESSGLAILSCSALKRSYRNILRENSNKTVFIHLGLAQKKLDDRLKSRRGHFFNPSLLQDQLNTLEGLDPSEIGFTINSDQNTEKIIADILSKLNDKKYEFQYA